jgi:hypothetical protein
LNKKYAGFSQSTLFSKVETRIRNMEVKEAGGWMKLAYLNGTGLREGSPAHDPITEKDFIAGRGSEKRDSGIVRTRNV